MTWQVKRRHVVPLYDLREHEISADCWCRPRKDDEDDGVFIHHSADRREYYEIEDKPLN
jgi:hypothetical protein